MLEYKKRIFLLEAEVKRLREYNKMMLELVESNAIGTVNE